MVLSSTIAVTANDEHLTCSGFSLGETVHLRNFKFIIDYFGSLSLSPNKDAEGNAFMGSTRSGASTPRRAMIEDSTKEFLVAFGREGSFGLPSHRRHGAGASLAPIKTTPWLKDILDVTNAQ
jgi:hypothetical protein